MIKINYKLRNLIKANLFLAEINWCHSQTFPKPVHRNSVYAMPTHTIYSRWLVVRIYLYIQQMH